MGVWNEDGGKVQMPKKLTQVQWTIWWAGYWVKGLSDLRDDFPVSGLASWHYG